MNNSQFFEQQYNANRAEWKCADGSSEGQSAQSGSARTYIIKIVNSCTSAIANVDIGDASNNRSVTGNSDHGAYNTSTNISLSCPVSDITYNEFLASSESHPFTVGTTVIISTSSGQLDNSATITHRNVSGDRLDHVITPTLDRFQEQTDRVLEDYEYLFDGMTRIRFSQINGSATVTVRLYAKNTFSGTNILSGNDATSTFSKPLFVKPVLENIM